MENRSIHALKLSAWPLHEVEKHLPCAIDGWSTRDLETLHLLNQDLYSEQKFLRLSCLSQQPCCERPCEMTRDRCITPSFLTCFKSIYQSKYTTMFLCHFKKRAKCLTLTGYCAGQFPIRNVVKSVLRSLFVYSQSPFCSLINLLPR